MTAPKTSYGLLAFFALLLSGCMGTPARNMDNGLNLESTYEVPALSSKDDIAEVRWWTIYDDPDLDSLITHAFANSPTLGQIRARLKQSSALKDEYSSSLWPSLSISATRSTYNGSTPVNSAFNLTGAASYEVDLWGKNGALRDKYALKEQASREDLYAGAVTLSATIVDSWLEILALLEQESLLRKQIEANQSIYEMQQKRFEMGDASALDVLQQEKILSASKAALPDILSAREKAANSLSFLIGGTPGRAITVHVKPLPEPLPLPEVGLPSRLMENRPDITAAWLRLLSSDKAIKIAKANRLPSFDLSAAYSTDPVKLSNIFDSWILTFVGALAAPVLDGGALRAEQLYQEALGDEAFHAYRETVLRAVNDVENALVTNRYQDEKIVALDVQLRATYETLEQVQLSYANGQSTYINVLNSLTSVHALEQNIITARLAQTQARVGLYRALGGQGWNDVVPSITSLIAYPETSILQDRDDNEDNNNNEDKDQEEGKRNKL